VHPKRGGVVAADEEHTFPSCQPVTQRVEHLPREPTSALGPLDIDTTIQVGVGRGGRIGAQHRLDHK
jgi:hypothetical protein